MNSLTLKSPAKLNLYLHVLRKRPDGYHDIETLFERIDLFDRVTLRKIPSGIRLTADTREIPWDGRNLAYRAASFLLQKLGEKRGVHIHLKKRIPVAGGLGGGSSNAATVLLGMNRLFGFRLSRQTLLAIGRRLGADVPFFLLEAPFAIGRKRGDRVTPIRSTLKMIHLVVNNRVRVSTQGVYQQANFGLTKRRSDAKIFQQLIEKNDLNGLVSRSYNALERPATKGYPDILKVKEVLAALELPGITLSGSGPTVFGFAESLRQAKALRKAILSKYAWEVFICRTY